MQPRRLRIQWRSSIGQTTLRWWVDMPRKAVPISTMLPAVRGPRALAAPGTPENCARTNPIGHARRRHGWACRRRHRVISCLTPWSPRHRLTHPQTHAPLHAEPPRRPRGHRPLRGRDRDLLGTCITPSCAPASLAMVHIGDSRAYVLRGDTFTPGHDRPSFVYLVDASQITPRKPAHYPRPQRHPENPRRRATHCLPRTSHPHGRRGDAAGCYAPTACWPRLPRTISGVMAGLARPGECARKNSSASPSWAVD